MRTAILVFAIYSAAPAQTLSTLYTFTGGSDGGSPLASLLPGKGGVLYGTTHFGGRATCSLGCGTVYSVTPPATEGGAWTEDVIHTFADAPGDGTSPYAGLTSAEGLLYGTTYDGGAWGKGTVYSLTPPRTAGGPWTEAVLYGFAGAAMGDGSYPEGGVVAGSGGMLYGTTFYGGTGTACANGCGTVYVLTPPASPGGAWVESVIYNFAGGVGDGANPSGITMAGNGVLYGNTSAGGSSGSGTAFSLNPPASAGGVWTEKVLYNFTKGSDGGDPQGTLVIGSGGVLYGTTFYGGSGSCAATGCGTVFALTAPTVIGGTWTESVLHEFAGGSDGVYPAASVSIGSGGVLYGTTRAGGPGACVDGCGTVFSLSPPAIKGDAWTEKILFSFGGGARGSNPSARVVVGGNGSLYGTTGAGGRSNSGTVFALKP